MVFGYAMLVCSLLRHAVVANMNKINILARIPHISFYSVEKYI